ncbi:polysaccharide biosynthesis tyrosine autokinase [Desulfurivibrio alkaliphilus]|uniref:Capsular exopolysaccharide family n=1 Tax=Desulfurivibrio alkaliphilus (strain DSM 19089 / UNIQEM U267 / AHT2) TaxID=589865 RepID=D6Z4F8_DESAT|nr:polysaccharide biosynthesis tyrosine autokinase [Desulfurivibrio alkaliphilus]ADH86433.1 capsular exopolysaccharide family [Desulfurivibrio alkaliphilus AHT 2]
MGKVHKALQRSGVINGEIPSADPPAAGHSTASVRPTTDLFKPQFEPRPPKARPSAPQDPAGKPSPAAAPAGAKPPTFAGWDERLLSAIGTASEVSEEFRRLRTQILHPAGEIDPPRTIMVVSAVPAEGKTLVSSGLAISLAQGVEEYALAIDCDLRRPALASMFGQDNDLGLADHLARGIDLGRLIRKTELAKLSLIPGGLPPANPAELLGSDRLEAMVDEVSRRYPDRYVIFDSPPLREAAETAILARLVDGVVLVVRQGRSRRDDIEQLVATIGPEKIVGVVFNAYQHNLLERKITKPYGGYYSTYRTYQENLK